MWILPHLARAQEGLCEKQSLRKLPLLVSFCFYKAGNTPGREQVQIWPWGFSLALGSIVKLVWGDTVNSSG